MATGDAWVQVAPRLDFKDYPWDLIEHDGKLYAAIKDGGRLFEWNGTDAWTQVAGHLRASGILSLAVYGGSIYGGTEDLLPPSPYHRGNLYLFTGSAWEQKAPQFENNTGIGSLCVYDGAIYGGTGWGNLLRWNDLNAWSKVATGPIGGVASVADLIVYNSQLYTACSVGLYRWNDIDAWVSVSNAQSIKNLAILDGTLYAADATPGILYVWNGVDTLTLVAPMLDGMSIFSLAAYDGKLYGGTGGTLFSGKLYEWNGVDGWVAVAPQLYVQKRIQELAVLNDKLYGITQPGGRLFEWNGVIAPVTVAEKFMSFTSEQVYQPFF